MDVFVRFLKFGEVFEAFIPFAESQRTKKFYGFVKISIDGARAALTCDEHVIAGRDIATVSLVGSAPDEPAKGEATAESQANPSDLSADPYYRTKLCKNYLERGSCPYEDRCWFAHGEAQLRPSDPAAGIGGHSSGRFAPPPEIRPSTSTHTTQGNRARNSNMSAICVPGGSERKMVDQAYRTKLCTHWEAGNCQYGDSCIFAHGAAGLRIFGEDEAGTYPRPPVALQLPARGIVRARATRTVLAGLIVSERVVSSVLHRRHPASPWHRSARRFGQPRLPHTDLHALARRFLPVR